MSAKGRKKKPAGGQPATEHGAHLKPNPDPELEPELLFQGISNPKKRRFLAAFAQCGSVTDAAKQAEIHFTSHYKWLKETDNVAYTEAFNQAREIAGDIAEGELYRRGVLGYDHPVIYEGQITTFYKTYSDTGLIFFLKGTKPDRYRENLNLSGNVGLPVDDFFNRIAERRRGETKP
jgi:hypothetical protein